MSVYFGPFPNYFNIFLESVRQNPDVDFVFVTDNETPAAAPKNARFVRSTLKDVKTRAEAALGVPVYLERPYNLCELKPMYAAIFPELFNGYDFWGYCDVDVVFGRIRKFISDDLLAGHDKIQCAGHLSLFRNTQEMREVYKRRPDIADWKSAISSGVSIGFDEWKGIYKIVIAEGIPYTHSNDLIADIDSNSSNIRQFGDSATKDLIYYYEGGAIFSVDAKGLVREWAYIHFQKRRFAPPSPDILMSERIYFTRDGFLPGKAVELSRQQIRRLNPVDWSFEAKTTIRRAYKKALKSVRIA